MKNLKFEREGRTVYSLHKTGKYNRDGSQELCNQFYFTVYPDYAHGVTDEEAEEVAVMVSAAPELLEALQNLLLIENLIQYPDDTKEEHQGEAEAVSSFINQAKAAITKATNAH